MCIPYCVLGTLDSMPVENRLLYVMLVEFAPHEALITEQDKEKQVFIDEQ